MTKFRFFKKKLRTKGANIAKAEALKTLLKTNDTEVDQTTFENGLKAATNSKHATDKILAMMKLRSMISTKKLSSKDDKQTTHITFPLGEEDKQKIKAIASNYTKSAESPTPIENFIKSYTNLGKLAKTKISWVITKMHNPKELAQLALTTEQRSKERNEVRALLKFIQNNPITPDSEMVHTELEHNHSTHTESLIYKLDVQTFLTTTQFYPEITIPNDFATVLTTYESTGKTTFTCGLHAYGEKPIE